MNNASHRYIVYFCYALAINLSLLHFDEISLWLTAAIIASGFIFLSSYASQKTTSREKWIPYLALLLTVPSIIEHHEWTLTLAFQFGMIFVCLNLILGSSKQSLSSLIFWLIFALGLSLVKDSSVFYVFYAICLGVALLLFLFLLNQTQLNKEQMKAVMFKVGQSLLQVLPFVLIIFVIIPFSLGKGWGRIRTGEIGFSGIVHPGEIERLSQSRHLAFEAILHSKQTIPPGKLYWRVAVLNEGKNFFWRPEQEKFKLLSQEELKTQKAKSDDETHLTTKARPMLFPNLPTLGPAITEHSHLLNLLLETKTNTLKLTQFPKEIFSYTGHYTLGSIPEISQADANSILNKHPEVSEKLLQLIKSWGDASTHRPEQFIENYHAYLNENGFRYSLKSGTIHNLESFLLTQKVGFCEHYAGALATVLEVAGFDARVVTGFLGGEYVDSQHIAVYSSDAHSWVEVYHKGYWHRYDSTAVVAPERLLMSGQQFFSQNSLSSFINWLSPETQTLLWRAYTKLRFKIDLVNEKLKHLLLRWEAQLREYLLSQRSVEIYLPLFLAFCLFYLRKVRKTELDKLKMIACIYQDAFIKEKIQNAQRFELKNFAKESYINPSDALNLKHHHFIEQYLNYRYGKGSSDKTLKELLQSFKQLLGVKRYFFLLFKYWFQ